MATRRYGISVGQTEFQITEAVGSATASNNIELTIDLGTTIVTDPLAPGGGGTRKIKKEEALQMIIYLQNWLIKNASGVLA
jgi:hypothetical protein